jgi:two-component system sensor histidine kinase CpxA
MKSLFVRLFISFLLAMLISGAVFFSLAYWSHPHRKEAPSVQPSYQSRPGPGSLFYLPPPPRNPALDGRQPSARPIGPPPAPPFFMAPAFQAAVFLLVGAGVCYLLARRLTAPIRRLRQTVQRLANGDLGARSGIGSDRSGDEINDLGHDVDRMAERIEALLTSQKLLVRDISHELRSPLARLQVALELARRSASPAAEPPLNRIEQEADRLNRMIGELLTLSLLDDRTALAHQGQIDLTELLTEVALDADFEAAQTGRTLSLQVETGLTLTGNRELVRQAVENVVRNALRYTAEGTTVELRADAAADAAIIQVRDHGPGVPAAMLESIFQPFFRVADDRDRQSGGSGIGLAITARAVTLHGGSVVARNWIGGGLEVEIHLPLMAA